MGCLCSILGFIFLLDGGGERVTWHMWKPSPAHLEEGREVRAAPSADIGDDVTKSGGSAGVQRARNKGHKQGRAEIMKVRRTRKAQGMANSTLADDTGPAGIPADGFYQKFKIPMLILFSTLAIAILGSTIWQCCFRDKKNNELEPQSPLPTFIGPSGVRREHNHLPYPRSPHYHPYGGSPGSSTRSKVRGREGREVTQTTSGWLRHAGPGRPLYRNWPQAETRVRIRVPPTTGTPLDGAYAMAYMQEEMRQEQPQQHREGRQQEEYEMEAHGLETREATPPPPYKARRSTDDTVDRPPGCLCAHVSKSSGSEGLRHL
ncbi:uncharacterized protein B0T23DRAFT_327175 [Neurospora hispaniola]|uniref:Uncharacterized protein n=1 Tax=Neurospora hispaniola TaxID=588809 RepID=A0AAJ0HZF4_9PEZI|nr:hypothetical protein B0T23DRAFT_327175 [Neurospora hispaniola]